MVIKEARLSHLDILMGWPMKLPTMLPEAHTEKKSCLTDFLLKLCKAFFFLEILSGPFVRNCPVVANAVGASPTSPWVPLVLILMCVFSPHISSNSSTSAVCPTIQLNSDTTYLKIDNHSLSLNLTRLSPTPDANHNSRFSPGFPTNHSRSEVSMTPFVDFINLPEQLRTQRNILFGRLPVFDKRI